MQIEQLFQRYKNGDHTVIRRLLSTEEPLAFDYLMRMTGMVDPSLRTIHDLEHIFSSDDEKAFGDFKEFRVEIYQVIRRFNEQHFSEDTSGLCLTPEGHSLAERLGRLPLQKREIVILRYRNQLDIEDIAGLCFMSEDQVRDILDEGIRQLDLLHREQEILALPLFPLNPFSQSKHGSVAVSQIMGDIERLNNWIRIKQILSVLFFVGLIIGAAGWFWRANVLAWIEKIRVCSQIFLTSISSFL